MLLYIGLKQMTEGVKGENRIVDRSSALCRPHFLNDNIGVKLAILFIQNDDSSALDDSRERPTHFLKTIFQ